MSLISAERCKKIVWNLNLWFHVWTSTFHQSGLSIGARPNSLSVRLQTQVLNHISPKVEDVTSNKNVHCTCKWNVYFFVCGHFVRVERWEVCELCRSFLVSIVINCRLILWSGSFFSFSEYCFQNFRAFLVRWMNNSSLYYLFLIGTNVNQAVSE